MAHPPKPCPFQDLYLYTDGRSAQNKAGERGMGVRAEGEQDTGGEESAHLGEQVDSTVGERGEGGGGRPSGGDHSSGPNSALGQACVRCGSARSQDAGPRLRFRS